MSKIISDLDNRTQSFIDRVVALSKDFISQASEVKDDLVAKRSPDSVDEAKNAVIAGAAAAAAFLRQRRSVVAPVLISAAALAGVALIYRNREQVKAAAIKAKEKATPALKHAQETLQARMQNLQSNMEQMKQQQATTSH